MFDKKKNPIEQIEADIKTPITLKEKIPSTVQMKKSNIHKCLSQPKKVCVLKSEWCILCFFINNKLAVLNKYESEKQSKLFVFESLDYLESRFVQYPCFF